MNLYDINKELFELTSSLEEFCDENGEISESFFQKMQELEEKATDKADNIGRVIRNYQAVNLAIDSEIERLEAKKQSNSKAIERLEKYTLAVMERFGKDRLDGILCSFSITTSKATIIEDESKLPERFRVVEEIPATTIVKYPKDAIKKALEAGEIVEGARIEVRKKVKLK